MKPESTVMSIAEQSPERAALERILAMIRAHGGEDASVNYSLLCSVQKIARQTLKGEQNARP